MLKRPFRRGPEHQTIPTNSSNHLGPIHPDAVEHAFAVWDTLLGMPPHLQEPYGHIGTVENNGLSLQLIRFFGQHADAVAARAGFDVEAARATTRPFLDPAAIAERPDVDAIREGATPEGDVFNAFLVAASLHKGDAADLSTGGFLGWGLQIPDEAMNGYIGHQLKIALAETTRTPADNEVNRFRSHIIIAATAANGDRDDETMRHLGFAVRSSELLRAPDEQLEAFVMLQGAMEYVYGRNVGLSMRMFNGPPYGGAPAPPEA